MRNVRRRNNIGIHRQSTWLRSRSVTSMAIFQPSTTFSASGDPHRRHGLHGVEFLLSVALARPVKKLSLFLFFMTHGAFRWHFCTRTDDSWKSIGSFDGYTLVDRTVVGIEHHG